MKENKKNNSRNFSQKLQNNQWEVGFARMLVLKHVASIRAYNTNFDKNKPDFNKLSTK